MSLKTILWMLLALPFATRATVPDRPPQLLPNGFHLDLEKEELYVHWKPLDEHEFGSTGFQYKVSTESGLESLMIGNHSVHIRKWDLTQPATVTIWSKNNRGLSVNSSQMIVPILTNAAQRQPREVYHMNNNTVIWRPPIEKQNLIGYIFFWCLISSDLSGACNDLEFIELHESQELFQFNKSLGNYHTAVAAKYSENISGGMIWSTPIPIWIYQSYIIMFLPKTPVVVMITIFGLIILVLKKYRKMRTIPGEFPDLFIVPMNSEKGLKTENFVNMKPSQDPTLT